MIGKVYAEDAMTFVLTSLVWVRDDIAFQEEPVLGMTEETPKLELQLPHRAKLKELLNNEKLPEADREAVEATLDIHNAWIEEMDALDSKGEEKVEELVQLLNQYKNHVELNLIFDSEGDFLYRQKGQLKLDNTVLEEFLPRLIDPDILPGLEGLVYTTGPQRSFASIYFTTTLVSDVPGGGLRVRTKDQDFTIGRRLYLKVSEDSTFIDTLTQEATLHLALVAAEIKTNLDKTMFQEAIATAHDLKVAVPAAKYFLICEWLDMTPLSTTGTDIDEVIILRGKRIPPNKRSAFSTYAGRQENRAWFEAYLAENPVRVASINRLIDHIRTLINDKDPQEDDVLERGYF